MAIGDRRDGKLIRDLDSLHFITGVIYPNRCDNEAYISERIDLTNINAYLERKNALISGDAEGFDSYRYNLFQIVVAAIIKAITLRPKMNRFIRNGNFYQRNEVSTAFVVKKLFSDNGAEALAFVHAEEDDTFDDLRRKLYEQISVNKKSDSVDESTKSMDVLNRIPRFLSKTLIHIIMWLDKHGWVPKSLVASDPYYSSCLISNVGSIKIKSGYHHLTNWGTCSIFCLLGEIGMNPVFKEDGTFEMRPTVDIGMTVDERLADGYYFSKTMRLIRTLLQNPELLELPMNEKVDY